ncbi:hypothetical protein N7467_010476 [Penicillium canescens]|nr:hypothetical protein N7467_010476 [Penicillium canescens]
MEIGPGSSIKWGVYREGARSQLPRFESLKREGPALIQAYQDVLDKDETFTQYFSDERLQSYDLESNLRTLLGIRPPLVDEPQGSNSQNDVSLSWVNIFRHGKFEKRDDGFYQCRMQGRLVKIDETMHKTILVNRCFLPPNSDPYVSAADVEKESEVNLSIEADVLNELHIQIKYVERLKRLQQSLKKRRHRLRGDQAPASIKRSGTPQSLRSNYPSPTESGLRLPVLSHAASDSQSGSRVSISVEPSVGLMKPAASIESQEAQERSASPSSSDVSTGEDIPFSRDHNSLKRKNMSSDYEETVDVDWDTQHQTPAPCNASTPLVSASKGKEPLAPEERNTMVDDSYAVAESRGTTAEGRDTTVGDSDAVVEGSDAMEVDGPSEVPKPVAPVQPVKQPMPKPETPRKSKRTLNWAASSLRQEYENAGQPIDLTSSPAPSFEAMQFGSDIAGRQGGIAPVPPRTGTVSMKIKPKKQKAKSHKKGVRVRNNFTQEEFDHAPAWLKPRLDAGMSPAKLEQEYEAKFGVLHRYNTLKLWLDRQEAKASPIKAPNTPLASTLTKIVVLKIPIPLQLRESFE